jgi:hypothetical protein
MKKIIALTCLIFTAACSTSPEKPVQKLTVKDITVKAAGIFKFQKIEKVKAKDTATGKFVKAGGVVLVKQTNRIKKVKGAGFGMRFVINGTPEGQVVPVTIHLLHPPIRNKKTGKKSRESKYEVRYKIGNTYHVGYGESDKGSLPLGKYTLKLIYENRELASQQFTVHR